MTLEELYKKVTDLIDAGDEAGARDFVAEHIMEFPEDMREAIVFEFFREAVSQFVEDNKTVKDFQQQGKEVMEIAFATDLELENQARIIDLKGQLQQ